MSLKLRLVRIGRRNRPFYRLRVADGRTAAGGRFLEELGSVDPRAADESRKAVLRKERIEHWLSVGAQPSATVRTLLKKNGIGCR